jgi:hypothetical protein
MRHYGPENKFYAEMKGTILPGERNEKSSLVLQITKK